MYIHVVQPGDTIYTIANMYGISPVRLVMENDIMSPYNLVTGAALVIVIPSQTYIVQEGDSLESIAKAYGTDVMELLRNNPAVSGRDLYTGEELVISYVDEKSQTTKTNGFAFPFIERATLRKTLPYLTYLTIYSYQIMPNGNLIDIDDTEVIQIAKEYGVAPIMFINAPHEGENVDTEIAHNLIGDAQIRSTFINNVLNTVRSKGYQGINIDTPYVQPRDRESYVELITDITEQLNKEGFTVTITIAPSTFEVSTGIIYTGVDYTGLSQAANDVLYQLIYAWTYPRNLPISVLPFETVTQTMDSAIKMISPEKFLLGISIVGYLWEFPFFAAVTYSNFINYNSALQLAGDVGSPIEFSERTRSVYFQYIENDIEYMAWFKDSRVIYPFLSYLQYYGLEGISIWNIMYFTTNIWLMINSQYVIEKA